MILVLGGLLPVATAEKNGLATSSMAKYLGYNKTVNNQSYLKFTRLANNRSNGLIEITLCYSPLWETLTPIILIISLHSDNVNTQGVTPIKLSGDNKVSLFKDTDGYLYIKHSYTYTMQAYVRILGKNLLLDEITGTPPELTEITIG